MFRARADRSLMYLLSDLVGLIGDYFQQIIRDTVPYVTVRSRNGVFVPSCILSMYAATFWLESCLTDGNSIYYGHICSQLTITDRPDSKNEFLFYTI